MSKEDTKIITSYCSSCCNENNHNVLYEKLEEDSGEDHHVATEYFVLSCCGCGLVSFRNDFHDYTMAYPIDEENWEHYTSTSIYPPFLKKHRQLDNYWRLPESIGAVYNESIEALKANCKLLAGAGFRAVIEAICLDKEIKGKNLEIKINNLSKEGLITKKECERLHSIRFIGNDSIHEMRAPSIEQLKLVLNIIEHLLKNIYLIDLEADSKLEKPINEFKNFKKLLSKKIDGYSKGDEFPLIKFLDRDVRRVTDNLLQFESDLINEIKTEAYNKLSIGSLKSFNGSTSNIQHYIVEEVSEVDESPF